MTLRLPLILLVAVLALGLLPACSSSEAPEPAAEETSQEAAAETASWDVAALKQKLDAGEDIFLLDVRQPHELEEIGAIKGAVNIPIDELEGRLSEVPGDKPVVTYCNRGGRASRAAKMLEEAGYDVIQQGGILDWKDAGYPVVHPEAEESEGAGS